MDSAQSGSVTDQLSRPPGWRPLSILLLNHTWLAPELRARGHQVVTAGWNSPACDVNYDISVIELSDLLGRMPAGFVPDRLVYYDNSRAFNLLDFTKNTIPSFFYSVDAHHHFAWHSFVSAMFDRTAVAQPDHLYHYRPFDPQVTNLPLWATENVEPSVNRDIDVSFRGNLDPKCHPVRAEFFKQLAEYVPIDVCGGYYVEPFCRSKIVVNHTVKDDLNFRVFEAMMCGALLITPEIQNGQNNYFTDGEDLITYRSNDPADAAEKIKYYLAHDGERERIARNGRNKVLAHHTAACRAADIEQLLLDLVPREKPKLHTGSAVAYISGAEVAWRTNRDLSAILLAASSTSLVLSAAAGEGIDQGLEANIMLVKVYLEELGQHEFAAKLIDRMIQYYPDNTVLALLKMEALLRQGNEDGALAVADKVSHIPSELIAAVIGLVDKTRQDILVRRQEPA